MFGEKNFHYICDAWAYIAVERHTKLILAFDLAKRNTMPAQHFTKKVANATGEEEEVPTINRWLCAIQLRRGDGA